MLQDKRRQGTLIASAMEDGKIILHTLISQFQLIDLKEESVSTSTEIPRASGSKGAKLRRAREARVRRTEEFGLAEFRVKVAAAAQTAERRPQGTNGPKAIWILPPRAATSFHT